MKIKLLLPLISLLIFITSASCTNNRIKNHESIEAAAIRDVNKVIESKENSMEREHAVLAIRVRHHALRSNGYEQEAELYINTTHHILVDSLHIIEDRRDVNEY